MQMKVSTLFDEVRMLQLPGNEEVEYNCVRRGAKRKMKDGRARTVRLDPIEWERTPSPKSVFLRKAIDRYLTSPQDQPVRPRSVGVKTGFC